MILDNNSKLVMIGDSITDCSRVRPIGDGLYGYLGTGYVSLVSNMLVANYPEKNIRVINMGVSGNTIRDLKARWQTDVIDLKPDYLSIMIGINDVWQQMYLLKDKKEYVLLEEYKETLEELVKKTKPLVKEIVLLTPYFIEDNKNDKMRKMMDVYGNVVKEIAEKYNTIYVNVQEEFDKALQYHHSSFYALDRVHPNTAGHMIIAKAFLNSIEMDWNK